MATSPELEFENLVVVIILEDGFTGKMLITFLNLVDERPKFIPINSNGLCNRNRPLDRYRKGQDRICAVPIRRAAFPQAENRPCVAADSHLGKFVINRNQDFSHPSFSHTQLSPLPFPLSQRR